MDAVFNQQLALARSGDARAAAVIGKHLLFGSAPHDGIAWLREAWARGDGEAPALLALLAANGVFEPRNTGKALDLISLSASRGWAPSQAELRLLAREQGEDWNALRRSIDVAALTKPPPSRVLSAAPRIRAIEGLATPEECDWLISRARDGLKRATVYEGASGLRPSDLRTNTEADLAVNACDVVTAMVLDRVAAAAHVSRAFCEVAKVMHYEPGQQFGLHSDFYQEKSQAHLDEIARNGQRIATLLIYLNDDYEGGETEFPKVDLRFKGRKGDALLFVNVDDFGAPDYRTLHAGLPPTRGTKWLFSQWVRGKPINAFMTPGAERETLDPAWLSKI